MGISGLLTALASGPLGALSDAIGRAPMLKLCTLIPVPYVVFALVGSVNLQAVLQVASALIQGCTAAGFAALSDLYPDDPHTRGSVISMALGGTAVLIALFNAALSQAVQANAAVPAIITLVLLGSAALLAFNFPETLPREQRRPFRLRQAEGLRHKLATVKDYDGVPTLLVMIFLLNIAEQGIAQLAIQYFQAKFSLHKSDQYVMQAMIGASMTAAQLVLGPVMMYFSSKQRRLVRTVIAAQALNLTMYAFAPSMTWVYVNLMTAGAVAFAVLPVNSQMALCMVPAEHAGMILGLVGGIRAASESLGPALFGVLLAETADNPSVHGVAKQSAFFVAGCVSLTCLALTMALPDVRTDTKQEPRFEDDSYAPLLEISATDAMAAPRTDLSLTEPSAE